MFAVVSYAMFTGTVNAIVCCCGSVKEFIEPFPIIVAVYVSIA